MSTFDPDALECLATILEEGGFERAVQHLFVTPSAVFHTLALAKNAGWHRAHFAPLPGQTCASQRPVAQAHRNTAPAAR